MSFDITAAFQQVKNHEDWKYTDVSALLQHEFTKTSSLRANITFTQLKKYFLTDTAAHRLVFVNGQYRPEFSLLHALPEGVQLNSTEHAQKNFPDLVKNFLSSEAAEQQEQQAFEKLNQKLMTDGWFLFLPKNSVLDLPIHVLFFTDAANAMMAHTCNIALLNANSQAHIIEEYISLNDTVYFNNCVTHVNMKENSVLQHCKLQQEGAKGFHIGTLKVEQKQGSRIKTTNITRGGQLSRENLYFTLNGRGAECCLNGLYCLSKKQHSDHFIQIKHQVPYTKSEQFYKGILDQQATAVFNGKIIVEKNAQKTDAKQNNQNLLLTNTATVNTKPALEIYADDVKCAHGATVGQLDQQALFYLRSRGIEKQAAIELLTQAFASEILDKIEIEEFRKKI